MSRSDRREWLRKRATERAAAGLPPKKPHRRSHYQAADIRDAVQADIQAMRQQIESGRKARDYEWAYRKEVAAAIAREAAADRRALR